jgi:hypothetical protein
VVRGPSPDHAQSRLGGNEPHIYKKPLIEGFGSDLFKAIEARLQKIMKQHLLPAGYEFQKVLDDIERLLSGKELLDRGALKALGEYSENNLSSAGSNVGASWT